MGKFRYIKDLIKLCAAKCISPIFKISNKKFRDIWLIGERKSEAKDNGYHLFKYIRENYPDDEVYYVIEKHSNDLEKIEGLGNIIYHDSFKHYLYYVMSSKLICAHLGSCIPDSPICWKFADKDIRNKKKVFIQHGITKELIPSLMYENTKVDLFMCGAKPEYDFVKENFGYPENSVKYTGFARFDALHDRNEKKQILVMPTWRKWIPSSTWSDYSREECKNIFINSEYYRIFNSLINNNELIKFLDDNSMKLIFYPHFEMQEYIDLFNTQSDKVIIANHDEYDVQTLLKESQLLITDYSSVAFDFAYMKKSIIYYQFDEEKYYKNHYQKGYYDYKTNGFGEVVKSIDELLVALNDCFNNRENKYKNRIKSFFYLNDVENCFRQYKEIKQI